MAWEKEFAKQMITKPTRLSRLRSAFGLALVTALAISALAASSAAALSMTPTPNSFSGGGGQFAAAAAGSAVKSCKASTSTGKALEGTSGEITLYLSGCTAPPWGSCTTAGQAAGTIATATLNYRLVYLDAAKTKFGLMLTPPDASVYKELPPPFDGMNGKVIPGSGTFAKFSCAGISYVWNGSVLGEITSPGFEVSSPGATLSFTASGTTQTYRQVEGAGLSYQLSEKRGANSPVDLAIQATHNMTFIESIKFLP
jgi:hypothetical protein